MKTTRSLVLALAAGALALTGTISLAQPKPASGAARPAARVAARHPMAARLIAMLARLNLTPAQKGQVRGILKDAQAKRLAIRNNTSLNAQQKRDEWRNLTQATRRQVLGVLTPGQKKKLAQMMRQQQNRRGILAILNRLDLSAAQKTTIRSIVQGSRANAATIRQTAGLSPEAKRQRLKDLAQATRRQVLATLTPQQRKKLQTLLQQQRR